MRDLLPLRVMIPEPPDLLLLAYDHTDVRIIAREVGEGCEGCLAAHFDECGMADQGDSLKLTLRAAAGVECPAVERAFQPVVADEPGHDDGVNRALAEKRENLFLTPCGKLVSRSGVAGIQW